MYDYLNTDPFGGTQQTPCYHVTPDQKIEIFEQPDPNNNNEDGRTLFLEKGDDNVLTKVEQIIEENPQDTQTITFTVFHIPENAAINNMHEMVHGHRMGTLHNEGKPNNEGTPILVNFGPTEPIE